VRRPQLTSTAVVIAPAMKVARAASPASARRSWPSARLSAIDETMPVMCEVYCPTARKPPAFVAPATNASAAPRRTLLCGVRRTAVSFLITDGGRQSGSSGQESARFDLVDAAGRDQFVEVLGDGATL